MFGMHVTVTLSRHFFIVRIGHYSKGNNIVWKKGRKSYEGFEYDRNIPILFIGGMPRSGTTLMRSMMGKFQLWRKQFFIHLTI